MSRTKAVFVLIAVLLLAASEPAWAWRGGVRFGVVIGAPFYPWYYPYPPYYYQPYPVVVAPPAPVTYVEQGGTQAQGPSFWYYCAESKAYYPYVKECPGGWMHVVPQAAPPTTQPQSTPPSSLPSKPQSPPQTASRG